MSAPEKFREAEPLEDDEHGLVALLVRSGGRPPSNDRLCEVCGVALTVPEARALRDWLTKALPEDKP